MTKMRFLILPLFLMFLMACNTTPGFVGEWELVSLELGTDEITAAELGNPKYFFNADKTYSIKVTGLEQNGTWELKEEQLLLTDNDNPDEPSVLSIIEIQEKMFHYTAGEGETKTHVILKKAD